MLLNNDKYCVYLWKNEFQGIVVKLYFLEIGRIIP